MSLTDMAKSITALAALVSLVFGAFFFIENRYTEKPVFYALEKRVSLNELRRQLRQAEEEAAYYRQLSRKYPDDQSIADKLEEAEKRVEELEQRIEEIEESNEG